MSKPFCPFIKDDCRSECIFNNGLSHNEDHVDNCDFVQCINIMQSFAFDLLSDDKKTPSKYLEAIKTKLANIESNTNSSSISSNVEDIKELLTKR